LLLFAPEPLGLLPPPPLLLLPPPPLLLLPPFPLCLFPKLGTHAQILPPGYDATEEAYESVGDHVELVLALQVQQRELPFLQEHLCLAQLPLIRRLGGVILQQLQG